jgi:hypothetical protein
MGGIPAFGHGNYGGVSEAVGMKRKRENDDDIPGVSMRGGGGREWKPTGANAVGVPTWIRRN